LIAAVEAYERDAFDVEGRENVAVCANDSVVADAELLAATTWLENYLQQRDVTNTSECCTKAVSSTKPVCKLMVSDVRVM